MKNSTARFGRVLAVRFRALMTPTRASIVGPPDVATRIKASIAACHSAASCSAFGSLVMYLPASSRVTRRRPRGNGIGSLNGRFRPFAALRANVVFPCNQAVGPPGRSGLLLVAALQPCLSGAVMPPHEHEVS